MLRFLIISFFALALLLLRLLDSILTRRLVESHGNGVQELNPFVDTSSLPSIFFSPVPVMVTLGVILLFAWMINRPRAVMLAYHDTGGSFSSIVAKVLLGAPLLLFAFMLVAVIQNASIWYLGGSLWPDVIRNWKVENPLLALLSIAMTLEIFFGHFFRKAVLALLRRVDGTDTDASP